MVAATATEVASSEQTKRPSRQFGKLYEFLSRFILSPVVDGFVRGWLVDTTSQNKCSLRGGVVRGDVKINCEK